MERCVMILMVFVTPLNFAKGQNYNYAQAKEGEIISINCNEENRGYTSYSGYEPPISPYLIVDEIQYTNSTCVHTNTLGVKDKCDNRASCCFLVSNTIVGSSCGKEGVADLWIKYHCVREGGWTQWSSYGGCSRTCGGGYQTRTRNCTNPPRNYFGTNDTCQTTTQSETQRCNTGTCPHSGSTCKLTTFSPTCNDYNTIGYMTITSGVYKGGCSWDYNTENPYHAVTPILQSSCNGNYSCSFAVSDQTLVSCYEDYYYQTSAYRHEGDVNDFFTYYYSVLYYMTVRYAKICGMLTWSYYCTLPQWTSWSSWSACSVSCGRGSQTRTRSCENERTTDDGYSVVCEQNGSELHNTETRECPMTASQPFCTYCEGAPDRFKEVAASGQSIDTYSGNAILLESDINIIRCCGVLTKITFVAMSNGTVTFVVWRPTFRAGQEHVRTVVGLVPVPVITDNNIGTLITYSLQTSERIAVKAGDLLGWYDASGKIIGQEPCSPITDPDAVSPSSHDYRPNYCPQKNLKTNMTSILQGMKADWDRATVVSNTSYAVEWEIDASLDNTPTFSMPTTSTRIPDNTAIDTYVMNFYFNDTDYGDSFIYYQPVYNHSYFYFDSNDLSVRVKTTLLHTGGTPEVEHTFVVWAEDTCYNRVTGTVTITTYNVLQTDDETETTTPADNQMGSEMTTDVDYCKQTKYTTYDEIETSTQTDDGAGTNTQTDKVAVTNARTVDGTNTASQADTGAGTTTTETVDGTQTASQTGNQIILNESFSGKVRASASITGIFTGVFLGLVIATAAA